MDSGNAKGWNIKMSTLAEKSGSILKEEINSWTANPDKTFISLETGDPLVHGNLKPSGDATDAVVHAVTEGVYNGYAPSVGYEHARNAIAAFLQRDGIDVQATDIVICGGCSSALDICITALAEDAKNHNVLVPKPGVPLYRNLAGGLLVEAREYNLLPEKNWEIDLYDLEAKIDANTACVVLNNPNNPTGAVYTERHLRELLEVCFRRRVPLIADEVHAHITDPQHLFTSIASIKSRVPILLCGGIGQSFSVPGWRLGWIAIVDRHDAFEDVRKGVVMLSQRIVGANTFVQGALPEVLRGRCVDDLVNTVRENARTFCVGIDGVKGLKAYPPQGTVFMVVELDTSAFGLTSGIDFAKKLCEVEAIKCLPLDEFGLPGYIRINLSTSNATILEAVDRIKEFCKNHYV